MRVADLQRLLLAAIWRKFYFLQNYCSRFRHTLEHHFFARTPGTRENSGVRDHFGGCKFGDGHELERFGIR